MINITIDGNPESWKSPQRCGNHYFSPNHKRKEEIKWQVKEQWTGNPIISPIKIKASFDLPIPSSTSKKKTFEMLNQAYHNKKPDLDNLLKLAIDSIKGIVIEDDNQVCQIEATKQYSKEPKTNLYIYDLSDTYDDLI